MAGHVCRCGGGVAGCITHAGFTDSDTGATEFLDAFSRHRRVFGALRAEARRGLQRDRVSRRRDHGRDGRCGTRVRSRQPGRDRLDGRAGRRQTFWNNLQCHDSYPFR